MYDLLIWTIFLIASLFVLIKSSDYFTDSAERIGLHIGMPTFIVGVTIVSIGTSLPELLTALFGVIEGSSEIVIADVVGSNITNIFLGLGLLPIVVGCFKITKDLISVDLPILIGSTFLLAITCMDGRFTLAEAIFCLAGIVIYIGYTLSVHRAHKNSLPEFEQKKLGIKPFIILIVSCTALFFGAKYTVESIIRLSEIIGIGTEIITASAVALGTSLPEIIASMMAARKGRLEMAVGTLLGSNIFNAFAIMGIAGLMGTLIIPTTMITYGIPMLIIATLLYFFITLDREITKWEGWLLIIFYVFYIGRLFSFF